MSPAQVAFLATHEMRLTWAEVEALEVRIEDAGEPSEEMLSEMRALNERLDDLKHTLRLTRCHS